MSLLTSTAPMRATVFPKSYLFVASRGYTSLIATTGLRYSSSSPLAAKYHHPANTKRFISSTQQQQIKEFFPPPNAPHIKETDTAWAHPVYVHIADRE